MKIACINTVELTVEVFRSKAAAAYDAGIERKRFARILDRDGHVWVGYEKYVVPIERG